MYKKIKDVIENGENAYKYLVYKVGNDGKNYAPTVAHDNYFEARDEALRLKGDVPVMVLQTKYIVPVYSQKEEEMKKVLQEFKIKAEERTKNYKFLVKCFLNCLFNTLVEKGIEYTTKNKRLYIEDEECNVQSIYKYFDYLPHVYEDISSHLKMSADKYNSSVRSFIRIGDVCKDIITLRKLKEECSKDVDTIIIESHGNGRYFISINDRRIDLQTKSAEIAYYYAVHCTSYVLNISFEKSLEILNENVKETIPMLECASRKIKLDMKWLRQLTKQGDVKYQNEHNDYKKILEKYKNKLKEELKEKCECFNLIDYIYTSLQNHEILSLKVENDYISYMDDYRITDGSLHVKEEKYSLEYLLKVLPFPHIYLSVLNVMHNEVNTMLFIRRDDVINDIGVKKSIDDNILFYGNDCNVDIFRALNFHIKTPYKNIDLCTSNEQIAYLWGIYVVSKSIDIPFDVCVNTAYEYRPKNTDHFYINVGEAARKIKSQQVGSFDYYIAHYLDQSKKLVQYTLESKYTTFMIGRTTHDVFVHNATTYEPKDFYKTFRHLPYIYYLTYNKKSYDDSFSIDKEELAMCITVCQELDKYIWKHCNTKVDVEYDKGWKIVFDDKHIVPLETDNAEYAYMYVCYCASKIFQAIPTDIIKDNVKILEAMKAHRVEVIKRKN